MAFFEFLKSPKVGKYGSLKLELFKISNPDSVGVHFIDFHRSFKKFYLIGDYQCLCKDNYETDDCTQVFQKFLSITLKICKKNL